MAFIGFQAHDEVVASEENCMGVLLWLSFGFRLLSTKKVGEGAIPLLTLYLPLFPSKIASDGVSEA